MKQSIKKLFRNPFVMTAIAMVYVYTMAFTLDYIGIEPWYGGITYFLMMTGGMGLFIYTVWLFINLK